MYSYHGAMLTLGAIYDGGLNIEVGQEYAHIRVPGEWPNLKKAFACYDAASHSYQNAYAKFKLGAIVEAGAFGETQKAVAKEFYLKADEMPEEAQNAHTKFKIGEIWQQEGRDPKAYIKKLEDAAHDGEDTQAMNALGSLSYHEKKEYTSAAEWFRKASAIGCPRALNNLGVCYELGRGVSAVDTDEAFHMYKESADKGYIPGMFNLGQLCYRTAKQTRS